VSEADANVVPEVCACRQELDELPLPYVDIDTEGQIVHANRAALALHHPDHGGLVGMVGWDLMAMDEKELSQAAFRAQIQVNCDPPVIIRSIFDRTGTFRTYQLHRTLIRDRNGGRRGMRLIAVDVTETTRALEEARQKCSWLESVVASVADAIVLTDVLGAVRSINPAAEELLGFRSDELAGKIIEEAVAVLSYQSDDGVPLSRRTAIEGHCKGTATLLNRTQDKLKVRISTSPVVDRATRSVVGIVATLHRINAE